MEGTSDGLTNTRLQLSPRSFNRIFVTHEINDGLLAPRLEPSLRARNDRTFQSFGDVFELGNDGRIAFVAKLALGVGGVDSSNDMGIWIGTSDEDLHLLVRTGEVIDGNVLTDLHLPASAPLGIRSR